MIVQERRKIGPGYSLSFQGGDKPVGLTSLYVFGESEQKATPSVEDPIPIVSVADGGSLTIWINNTDYYIAINSLRGIKYREPEYGYLVGNGAYLLTQGGDRLMAK